MDRLGFGGVLLEDVSGGWDDVTQRIVEGVVSSIRREYFMGYVGKMREMGRRRRSWSISTSRSSSLRLLYQFVTGQDYIGIR